MGKRDLEDALRRRLFGNEASASVISIDGNAHQSILRAVVILRHRNRDKQHPRSETNCSYRVRRTFRITPQDNAPRNRRSIFLDLGMHNEISVADFVDAWER